MRRDRCREARACGRDLFGPGVQVSARRPLAWPAHDWAHDRADRTGGQDGREDWAQDGREDWAQDWRVDLPEEEVGVARLELAGRAPNSRYRCQPTSRRGVDPARLSGMALPPHAKRFQAVGASARTPLPGAGW